MSVNLPLAGWLAFWRYKQRYHRYTVEGLERLVDSPPALIVGYHGRPFAYDVCMLTVALYDALGYLPHGIVHRGVKSIPLVNAFFEGIGFVTGDEEELAAVVARGEHVVVTPGGAGEGCRSFRQQYRVAWGERFGYLRLALKYRLPIVPVAAAGADEAYIGLNDAEPLGTRLGLPRDWAWLPWLGVGPLGLFPFSPPFPVRMRQLVGEPIDLLAGGPVGADDRDALRRLHGRVVGAVQGLLDRARGG
jgi:1-acyl-sn-glycerol-3-phosphate acyltransferase